MCTRKERKNCEERRGWISLDVVSKFLTLGYFATVEGEAQSAFLTAVFHRGSPLAYTRSSYVYTTRTSSIEKGHAYPLSSASVLAKNNDKSSIVRGMASLLEKFDDRFNCYCI